MSLALGCADVKDKLGKVQECAVFVTSSRHYCVYWFQIHAQRDDLGLGGDEGSLATGNAGARLACCTIALTDDSAWP